MGATHKMATQIKLRRDTAANWTSTNPILALGEPGIEIDTRKIKYGDGTTAWTSLSYSAGDANFSGNYTDLSNKPTIPAAQIQSDWTQTDNTLKDFIKNKPVVLDGAPGTPGADALWNFTGAYGSGTAYAIGDVATYGGETWYRLNANGGTVGNTPVEGIFWTKIAEKGADGSPGADGADGSSAYQGLNVTASGSSGFLFDQYGATVNPEIYVTSGQTLTFNLDVTGHPFLIQTSAGADYSIGLTHVATTGTVSTASSAQGKVSGTLYWKVPYGITGTYKYKCSIHGGMIGNIIITDANMANVIPAAQIQSDWTQATNTALDYIKNKPTLVTNLDSLSDVTITSASSGQVLKYNGTAWINDTDSTGGGLPLSNGNSIINIASVDGNITLDADGNIFTFGTDGNLTLPTNSSNINYANGTSILSGLGGGASTGNVTFSDQILIGTGSNDGSGGLYLAPGNASIANSAVQYLRVRGGDVATHIHLDTGNNAYFDQYFGDDGKYVKLANTGNVVIGSDNANGNSAQWTFDTDGNLTTPNNLVIGAGSGSGSRIFQYDDGLEIVGEGANSVVLMGWAASLSAPDGVALIAMNYPSGGEGNILITVGNNATTVHSWLFGNNGDLTLPAGGDIVDSTGNSVLGGGGGVGTLDSVTDTGSTTTNGITVGSVTLTNGAVIKDTAGDAVAFGEGAGTTSQGANSVAVGAGAGSNNQGYGGVAVGAGAGATGQGIDATAIGTDAGATDQGGDAVAVGEGAGYTTQGGGAVAVGNYAGHTTQGTSAVAIGTDAGETNQGDNAVAIGESAGETTQGNYSVAVGQQAGTNTQGASAVAVGYLAGTTSQGASAVAIGLNTGSTGQGTYSVAIGPGAGHNGQGNNSVAIGLDTGLTSQGTNAVAIGKQAGETSQAANSIILNATGVAVNGVAGQTDSFYVAPIRSATATANVLYYDTTTKEVTYGAVATGGIALTDLSIGTDGTPTGGGNISYVNTTGVFTYTPPVIPDVSGFALTSDIPDVSGFVTGTPWTSEGYLTTITNIFDQALNTTNNVTFSSVITSNVQATNGSPARASPVAVGGAGAPLTIGAGDGGIAATGVNAGAGGNLTITAGDAGSDIGNPSWGEIGGTLVIRGGNSSRPYHGSDVQIHSGNAVTSPGAISLYTGTNQWTFGKDGTTTLASNATIISPLTGLTVRVTGQYNICTVLTGGSGYEAGNSTSLVTGGSGTGMVVGYGYGLSGQIVSVGVTTAGTGYLDGEVLTMTAGDGTATFVITKYNSNANPNTNTAPSDWIFGTTNNLTLPLGGDIKDSTGTSVLFSGDYTDLSNQPTIPAAQIQSDWTQATNTALDYIKNKPTILAEPAFSVQTADFNATAGSRYGYNTTAGVVTATLPASPATGDAIYFADASGTTSTNNFIIARNGGTIMSSASDMTTNTNDQSFGLFYNGTTWRVY